MTQLEMKLLRYFVENEGRIIPRRELLENVWDLPGTSTPGPRTSSSVACERRSSRTRPSPSHFLTLRDAGYRFVANPEQ